MATKEPDANFSDSFNRLNMDDRVGPDGEPLPKTEDEYAQSQLTLRAVVSSKEAGVIIGKAGKNVADLRDATGVKAGVSKVITGVNDRVLTVSGELDGISKAYMIVAKGLLEGAAPVGMGGIVQTNGTHLRLLISHNQMGTIIGRQGLKIKQIQDMSGVRMVAQKEMLPQSTERIVEIQGPPEGIQKAVWEIGKCLVDDWQRGQGTVLYNPQIRAPGGMGDNGYSNGYGGAGGSSGGNQGNRGGSMGLGNAGRPYNRTGNGADFAGERQPRQPREAGYREGGVTETGEPVQTQNISIPADMVGCIIGRGGSKITEIRKSSGAQISIAKAPHDETNERMFTLMGSESANNKALLLLYQNLEEEKNKRNQASHE